MTLRARAKPRAASRHSRPAPGLPRHPAPFWSPFPGIAQALRPTLFSFLPPRPTPLTFRPNQPAPLPAGPMLCAIVCPRSFLSSFVMRDIFTSFFFLSSPGRRGVSLLNLLFFLAVFSGSSNKRAHYTSKDRRIPTHGWFFLGFPCSPSLPVYCPS